MKYLFACCLFIMVFVSMQTKIFAQDKGLDSVINSILPVITQDDYNTAVKLFERLLNRRDSQSFYWDKIYLELFQDTKRWAKATKYISMCKLSNA